MVYNINSLDGIVKPKDRSSILFLSALAVFSIVLLFGIISLLNRAQTATSPGPAENIRTPQAAATATSVWSALLEMTPVAYTTPLPDPVQSPLDGTYAKIDPSWPQWWTCLRCADYRPAGGIWKLRFDKGVMRIYYEVTGWRSLASFTVSGDRLYLFNDAYCPDVVGGYRWKMEDGVLKLEVVDDPCSFQLRGRNLSNQPWSSCPPADEPIGADDSRQEPPGCEDNPVTPATTAPSNLPVTVVVHGGDSRFFDKPPDVFAHANSADSPSPEGIRVTQSRESIPYGLNRILWWEGDWIQVSTELPFTSLGVQFLGEPQTGWARVLFDGIEVWRGNTSTIWSKNGRHGGYIEISGFSAGAHTLRTESLGFDYRPVTVASFGFSYQDGVNEWATNQRIEAGDYSQVLPARVIAGRPRGR